jgi:hypothetical protein
MGHVRSIPRCRLPIFRRFDLFGRHPKRSSCLPPLEFCIVPRASSPGIAASDLGVRSLCACGNWEGTCGAVCRNCAQANEVQATTPQTSELSAHDVEFDVMLGSPRSVTFSPGASLVLPAQRLSPNAATRKSGQTRIRVAKDARSGDADRCWLQSAPVASPKLRKFGCGVSHDELVAVAQCGARGQLPSTRPIFFQLMFDQVMFGSTLLAIPRASMFLFEGLAIGSTGVSSVSIEASALAAC